MNSYRIPTLAKDESFRLPQPSGIDSVAFFFGLVALVSALGCQETREPERARSKILVANGLTSLDRCNIFHRGGNGEDIGISIAAFNANKDYIVNWFKAAISTGAFEERTAEDRSSSIQENESSQSLEDSGLGTVQSQPLEDVGHENVC